MTQAEVPFYAGKRFSPCCWRASRTSAAVRPLRVARFNKASLSRVAVRFVISFSFIADVRHALLKQRNEVRVVDAIIDFPSLPPGSDQAHLPQAAHVM